MGLRDTIEEDEFGFEPEQIRAANAGKSGFSRIKPSTIEPTIDKYFREGKPRGLECGIKVLDPIFRIRRKGGLYIVTGYEQNGKSEFLKYLAVLQAKNHGFKTVLYSPEEEAEDIIEDLARTYLGMSVNKNFGSRATESQWSDAKKWIEEYFVIIEYDGMVDFKTLVDEWEELAKQGYKMFICDPWNYVAEGNMDAGGTKYLKTALSHMKTFSKRYKCHVFIVEHQNNKTDIKGNLIKANKNNIQGGSMWKHKADVILIVHSNWTPESEDSSVQIESAKIKNQRYNGVKGMRTLWFDLETGRYLENSPDGKQSQFAIEFGKKLHPEIDAEREEDEQPF